MAAIDARKAEKLHEFNNNSFLRKRIRSSRPRPAWHRRWAQLHQESESAGSLGFPFGRSCRYFVPS